MSVFLPAFIFMANVYKAQLREQRHRFNDICLVFSLGFLALAAGCCTTSSHDWVIQALSICSAKVSHRLFAALPSLSNLI
jgi:hypothetical protein